MSAFRAPVTRAFLASVALALLVLVGFIRAQSPGVHPISGREFAFPMGVGGADWLDRPERAEEEQPDRALKVIGIQPGSTVADIGAGSGYFTVRLARLVGPQGKVYANDLQAGMLSLLRRRLSVERVANVETVLGAVDDPRLPPASLDLILLVDVYHEFSAPQVMLRRMREALKPGGRLVLLEYRAEDPRVPIRPEHKMTVAQAKLEVENEAFTLSTVHEDLPWQHILVFTPR
jgi:predicted methyltransferase